MPRWSDKDLIDADPDLLDEKDRVRQIKLQEKRAKKEAKEEAKREKTKAKDLEKLAKKHMSGSADTMSVSKEDI
jgi:hypothetical protein